VPAGPFGADPPRGSSPHWNVIVRPAARRLPPALGRRWAIWRGFGPAEMLLPCAVLVGVGAAGFVLGARLFAAEG